MTRREAKKEDKRRRIVEAARALFAEAGFDGATTREIARRAGIGAGTLFLYAPTKLDLLLMLYIDGLRESTLQGLTATSPEDPLLDQCVHIFGGFFRLYEPDPLLARRFVRETLFVEGARQQEYEALNLFFGAAMVERVMRAQARGAVKADLDPADVVKACFAFYALTVYEWICAPPLDAEVAIDRIRRSLRLLFEGIGA
jgi:AcrR family transcriptional regulator